MHRPPKAMLVILVGVSAATFSFFFLVMRPRIRPHSPAPNEGARLTETDKSTRPAGLPTEKLPNPCDSIFTLVCGNRQILEDPTGVVQPDIRGEVEALRIYET